jgi:deferrochelatase/peroxidase EfeB
LDLLLIVAANNEGPVTQRADQLVAGATAAGFRVSYRETAHRFTGDREQFGFRDGISQPRIHRLRSGWHALPGNFIFGYPSKPGLDPVKRAVDHRNITDNGSHARLSSSRPGMSGPSTVF